MSSSRLPEKVLRQINGDVMLGHVVKRVASANGIDKVVVATSDQDSDNEVIGYCKEQAIEVITGPLDNVVARFLNVLSFFKVPAFLRVTADSPLIDPALIEKAIGLTKGSNHDIVTNVFPRTFPKGQSVEIIKTKVFENLNQKCLSEANKEHITSFFYDHSQCYDIANFTSGVDYSHVNMSVDTETDLKTLEEISASFNGKKFNWLEASRRLISKT